MLGGWQWGGRDRTGLAISSVKTGNPAKAHAGAAGLNQKGLPGLVYSACHTFVTSGWKLLKIIW